MCAHAHTHSCCLSTNIILSSLVLSIYFPLTTTLETIRLSFFLYFPFMVSIIFLKSNGLLPMGLRYLNCTKSRHCQNSVFSRTSEMYTILQATQRLDMFLSLACNCTFLRATCPTCGNFVMEKLFCLFTSDLEH